MSGQDPKLKHLSKFMSLVLRHDPDAAGVELDVNGATPTTGLLDALQRQPGFHWVTMADVETVVREGSKPRFEILDDRIRARWGHSTAERIEYPPANPPEHLYHGTSRKVVPVILRDGLKSMTRQYVHLSADVATARLVGSRQDRSPSILKIRSREASRSGVVFHGPDPKIWLADEIPAAFIDVSQE